MLNVYVVFDMLSEKVVTGLMTAPNDSVMVRELHNVNQRQPLPNLDDLQLLCLGKVSLEVESVYKPAEIGKPLEIDHVLPVRMEHDVTRVVIPRLSAVLAPATMDSDGVVRS